MDVEPLLIAAIETVRDPAAKEQILEIAVDALSSAVDRGLALPGGVAQALWDLALRLPTAAASHTAAGVVGEIADEDLANQIVRDLGGDADDRTFSLCIKAASGAKVARLIDDRLLVAMVDRRWGSGYRTTLACSVIARVAEERDVAPAVLASFVERWAASDNHTDRMTALVIAGAAGTLSPAVAEQLLLRDAKPSVRLATAAAIGELLPREAAIGLIDRALAGETDPDARKDLLAARSDLDK